MIRVTLTDAAYDAIASTLPKGAARLPMQRNRGQCFIHVLVASYRWVWMAILTLRTP
jgi:hypothetical protein